MGFIANGLIKRPILVNNNVNMLANSTIYNPIIGSNLGIPLNILQYVFTTTYYHENILNNEFNKLVVESKNDLLVTDTEIASATFLCRIQKT